MHPAKRPLTRPPAAATWLACVFALLFAACSDHERPAAGQAIADIDAAVNAAGTAPAKFIPGELEDVQRSLAGLKEKFARKEYEAVLDEAPAVLAAAKALAPAAAARERELNQALREEWETLVTAVPAELSAVAAQIDRLAARRRLPAGLTAAGLGEARNRLRDALALWDRAREEQAGGRLPEAVTLANQVHDMARQVGAATGAAAGTSAVK